MSPIVGFCVFFILIPSSLVPKPLLSLDLICLQCANPEGKGGRGGGLADLIMRLMSGRQTVVTWRMVPTVISSQVNYYACELCTT